jgi:predicted metal-dependent enzyme (double-stranded beta helix superfamily)
MSEQLTLPLPPVTDIDKLPLSLYKIAKALEARHELSPAEMRALVMDAQVTEEDILPWADFEHPIEDSYGRRMIYKAPHFEIMVMSWRLGNVSAIHDHGHTQWGAVQVFGPAEHATFAVKDGQMHTSARFYFEPGDVVGVSHELIHQMGNTTSETPFLSLHVYGQEEEIDSITGDARVYELMDRKIQRVDGGVFFALPEKEVKKLEDCPQPDFPTRLRHMVELCRRLKKMVGQEIPGSDQKYQASLKALYASSQPARFEEALEHLIANKESKKGVLFQDILEWELSEAVQFESTLGEELETQSFRYADFIQRVQRK